MEYVEVRGKSVEIAVQAAMDELGVSDPNRVAVEVLQEPERGFLGIGGREAVVKVSLKPASQRRRRRRRRRKGGGEGGGQAEGQPRGQGRGQGRPRTDRPSGGERKHSRESPRKTGAKPAREERQVPIEEQVPVVREFLQGLVEAFGLEGEVAVTTDDDVMVAEITGEQTEAMVGARGSVIEAIHELTKTVLHRKCQDAARLRLDIAGYAERRRQALAIYASQLIDQVMEEGGELMLEPMSAADRKVIHDAVAAREGVRSYSEGEPPQRYVVIARQEEADSEEE